MREWGHEAWLPDWSSSMGLSVVHIKELERVERSISAYSIRCVCYLHLFTRTTNSSSLSIASSALILSSLYLNLIIILIQYLKWQVAIAIFLRVVITIIHPIWWRNRYGLATRRPSPSGRRCECVRKIDDGVQSSQLAKLGSNAFLITKPASSFCKGGRRIIFFSFGTKGRTNYQLLMQLKYSTHIYKTRAIRPQNSRTLKMPQFEFGILTEKLDNASPGRWIRDVPARPFELRPL